jgi:L-lactate dehydrogenase complex protein LldG
MASREEFIASISGKLGRPKPEPVQPPRWTDHPAGELDEVESMEEMVALFIRELKEVGGMVHRVNDAGSLSGAIQSFIRAGDPETLVIWDSEDKRARTIQTACHSLFGDEGGDRVILWKENTENEALVVRAERAGMGIVYADYGIAETGTVVLLNGGGRGRSVSLLPNSIGILLRTSDMHRRITPVLRELKRHASDHSCINFITGPSRSADIEMSLSIGVHGPGRVTVFLIDE